MEIEDTLEIKKGTTGDYFDSNHPEYDQEIWEITEILPNGRLKIQSITGSNIKLEVPVEKFYPLLN